MKTTTLVIGASENPERYSFKAINSLLKHNHHVEAIGIKAGQVAGVAFKTGLPDLEDIDTVTLYVNPANQKPYYDYIISLTPHRIIFNPGTENTELAALALQNHIEPVEACTLVLLSTGQY